MSAVRPTDQRPIPDAVGQLRLHVRRPSPGAAVIEVAGELDLATAPRLAEVVESRIRSTVGVVIVDLGRTTFLAVSGLRTLHHLQTLAREHDVDFYVDHAGSHPVRRLLERLPLGCERPGIAAGLTRIPAPRGIPT
ncbi:STAS domain-containing protein [Amycolatopsis saalfeldensis]|uniref:Anti-anti-sigma factor n=1 Tax=Amycolatopsis saalfeldensis TaxID=394193 RepID=A0A1H8YFM4_9PSEU|nr:STAS domain-containing protein [Amycolatopsis saalfeldensis]SEP50872.1 anti-anti-sigma factor [Amycolatopsis saalfeldensis]